jgi:ammonium transporter, Amt family
MPKVALFIERRGIDDVVGAVAVHGVTGTISGILPGIFAAGYVAGVGQAPISLAGQVGGVAITAIFLGFLPGYGASWLLKKFDLLRVDDIREEKGLDVTDLGVVAYPEQTFITPAKPAKVAA